MREQYVEAVLAVADLIPRSQVLAYGDIATLLESGGPRQVGAVMSAHGGAVSWWRVVRANGAAPACHEGAALQHYRQEQTPLRGDTAGAASGWRLDMATARWRPTPADFQRLDTIVARLQDADDAGQLTIAAGPPLRPGQAPVKSAGDTPGPHANVSAL